MIYTITTNPSLDYYLKLDELKEGETNRSEAESYDAAGKGVNVSKFLSSLNIESVATGFLGGYVKDYYVSLLSQFHNIQPQFYGIKDNTRINVKILSDTETSLNARGPQITDEEFDRFALLLGNIFDTDYVVLSGNIQDELKDYMVAASCSLLGNGVKLILDTDRYIVEKLVEHRPFLVKMSDADIGRDEKDIVRNGREYCSKGVRYLMYSAHDMPTYLFSDECYYRCRISDFGNVLHTGANDSMIAGFLWGLLKGANGLEAFTCANAVALSVDLHKKVTDIAEVNRKYSELKIERFDY
ncbi:MAG: hypothetical protein IKF68_00150 [Erysipelotrichaceae bacterium]|nr:hypothetical protein [Erysipelotrichaceae bacterium]